MGMGVVPAPSNSPRFRVHSFRLFRVFRILLRAISSDPCFSGVRGTSAAFSPYWVRIADFENPTDRLYYDRP